MILKQFEEKGLSHYSYATGCSEIGQIAIIDPRYDVDLYLEFAEENNLVISHVFETHIHADYASGARYLAARSGAEHVLSGYDKEEKYEVSFPHKECFDGDLFKLGKVTLKVLHTPGHTPEHVSFLMLIDEEPKALFSGDFIFVGSVGRPDLIGKEVTESLAKQLYHSVSEKLKDLPDSLEIYPAHGSGSFCGGGVVDRPYSTLGQERLSNPFLNPSISEREFVDLVLSRTPHLPDYYFRMKVYNSCSEREQIRTPIPLDPLDFQKHIDKGGVVIDLRNQTAFSRGHIPGAICIGAGEKLGFWASSAVSYDCPILLVTSTPLQVEEAIHSLARIGLNRVEGYLEGGMEAWNKKELPLDEIPELTPQDLFKEKEVLHIIDVRSEGEWAGGHIADAKHIPCSELTKRIKELPDGKIAFVCAGGYRSILAASVAKKLGREIVFHLPGGVLAWRTAGLPLTI
ncbi:MAG: MBL fold metallo-hydrolase [Simkaniaceae bacterium]|jgi:hydroxyacylglutathione hydrolase|nr:MAG: MBL fold metallo-hydrolase [Simkaniaceae bacterium]